MGKRTHYCLQIMSDGNVSQTVAWILDESQQADEKDSSPLLLLFRTDEEQRNAQRKNFLVEYIDMHI